MSEYKNGFTLIEVLLVMVMIISVFSMSLSILSSFSKPNYDENTFDEIKSTLSLAKYFQIQDENNVEIKCSKNELVIYIDSVIVDSKKIEKMTCTGDVMFRLENSSSTFNLVTNQYGYVTIERI